MSVWFYGSKANNCSVRHRLKDNEGPFLPAAELKQCFSNVESTPESNTMSELKVLIKSELHNLLPLKDYLLKYLHKPLGTLYSLIHNE